MSKKKNKKHEKSSAEELEKQTDSADNLENSKTDKTTTSENEDVEVNSKETSSEEPKEEQVEEVKEKLTETDILKKELAELKKRYHRALADYQNLQRRSAKEVLESRLIGVGEFAKRLLPVIDTLEKAMQEIAKAELDDKVRDGLELFAVQFSDFLETEGLKEIPAINQKFDPNLHEALLNGNDETKEDGIILAELNKGYTFKDRVLRPSQVQINNR